jgi:hypothetical protein
MANMARAILEQPDRPTAARFHAYRPHHRPGDDIEMTMEAVAHARSAAYGSTETYGNCAVTDALIRARACIRRAWLPAWPSAW